MGILCYILGRSGTGKSSSMKGFDPEKLAVINVQGKPLPFKGSGRIKTINTDDSTEVVNQLKSLAKEGYKTIVVDDFQYLMANEFMRRSDEKGWDKYTDIARHAWDIPESVRSLPADVIVYIMCHIDSDQEGNEKLKTIGKMLDEKIVLEGMSTIVLKTGVSDGHYMFFTQNNGKDTTKSPDGMFPAYAIDNDLAYVDAKIRSYYEIGDYLTDEEMQDLDDAVKHEEVEKEPRRRSRNRDKKEEEKPAEAPKEETSEEAGTEDDTSVSERPKRSRRRTEEVSEPAEDPAEDDLPFRKKREPVEEEPAEEEAPAEDETPKRRRRRA